MEPDIDQTGEAPMLIQGNDHSLGLLATFTALLLVFYLILTTWRDGNGRTQQPLSLCDPVPFVFNTLQFLTRNDLFMERAMKILGRSNIVRFYMGNIPVYLVSGEHNIHSVFERSHKLGNEKVMVHRAFPILYKMSNQDVQRFAKDKSGRGRLPAPGTGTTPQDHRYWHAYEHVHSEYLSKGRHLKPIIEAYRQQLSENLDDRYPANEWVTVNIVDFCRYEITRCAISTLFGPKVFETSPDILDAFWDLDERIFMLTLGFPRWLYPAPYEAHDRFLAMIEKYLASASAGFDWNGPDSEAYWEPHFGARVCREIVKWLQEAGFGGQTVPAALGALLFAQNSNTIPTTMWALMEIFRDAALLQAVRDEIKSTYIAGPGTPPRTIDIQKVVSLPLLQSVFTEVLRLHMNFNVIRNVNEPITLEGFQLQKGDMLQVPMLPAHYDELVWGIEGHPASEFWAERHIKYEKGLDQAGNMIRKPTFSTAGKTDSFFPFGGGHPICPGRLFAKHEILTTIALMVSKFDIEPLGWISMNGEPSSRAAKNDKRYCGAGAAPPDRNMKVRLRRAALEGLDELRL